MDPGAKLLTLIGLLGSIAGGLRWLTRKVFGTLPHDPTSGDGTGGGHTPDS
jgi:hypothetical protein